MKVKRIGVLTAGGDCPGLNAAVRGVGKAATGRYGMEVVGIRDGYLGLIQDRTMELGRSALSGILTVGGTMLGTSRIKPHRMDLEGESRDMRDSVAKTYERHGLDALVCIGGGGTNKNAKRLVEKGLNVITLPKTIDNDIALTDTSIGFDTALGIATEAIDRLHSTAHSHHRIIIAEVMGHRAGWLTLGAGIAGGADVILIPEIPYDVKTVADAIKRRRQTGSTFSIVAVAEGALSREDAARFHAAQERKAKAEKQSEKVKVKEELVQLDHEHAGNTLRLSKELEKLTGLESRVSILGYVQRGGTPSAGDRLLATRLGTACVDLLYAKEFGVMVAARGDELVPVPIEKVAGQRKEVPRDHAWVKSARSVGVCLGDE